MKIFGRKKDKQIIEKFYSPRHSVSLVDGRRFIAYTRAFNYTPMKAAEEYNPKSSEYLLDDVFWCETKMSLPELIEDAKRYNELVEKKNQAYLEEKKTRQEEEAEKRKEALAILKGEKI